jgi:hypothetical protein
MVCCSKKKQKLKVIKNKVLRRISGPEKVINKWKRYILMSFIPFITESCH